MSGHISRQRGTVRAARSPIRPHLATCNDAANAPEKRKVGGSIPPLTTTLTCAAVRLVILRMQPGSAGLPNPVRVPDPWHGTLGLRVGCPAFPGQRNWCYFMPRAAGSGTRRGPLAESGRRVPNGDESDCTGARCTVQCPPVLSSLSGKQSGGRARLSARH